MAWTPELIATVATAAATITTALVAVILHKFKVIKIPVRRNSNQFSGMSISELEKRCREIHKPVEERLTGIDKMNSEQTSDIKHMEKRLDKGDEKFDTIIRDIGKISVDIGIMDAGAQRREKDLTNTITDATALMREILQKGKI